MTRRAGIALVAVSVLAALSMAVFTLGRGSPDEGGSVVSGPRAPEGVRIRVQVLNASTNRGMAREATRLLRDLGYDVVEMGNDATRDSTIVLDRSNHPEWASLVARALGGAASDSRPDSSRYLDVTVLLGRTWRPP